MVLALVCIALYILAAMAIGRHFRKRAEQTEAEIGVDKVLKQIIDEDQRRKRTELQQRREREAAQRAFVWGTNTPQDGCSTIH